MTNDLAIRILTGDVLGTTEQTHEAVAMAVKALSALPSAERVAHWEKGRCSRCYAHAPFWMMASTYYSSNYCPNCGARMDEGSE